MIELTCYHKRMGYVVLTPELTEIAKDPILGKAICKGLENLGDEKLCQKIQE